MTDLPACRSRSTMRRLATLAAAMLLAIVAAGTAVSQPIPAAPLERFTDRLDGRIRSLMERYEIPGVVVALVREGRTVWTAAYGLADVGEGRPMTTDTRCRVESISKSVTAWGVLVAADRGLVSLDAPVTDYLKGWQLPRSPYDETAVTARLLLANVGGMPLGTVGVHYPPGTPRPTLQTKLTHDAVLSREPGTAFEYSNAGYNVLEQLIQEATGQDFGQYMENEVLRPLGMVTASYDWSDGWIPPVPDGHDPDGRPIPPYVYPDRASGGLFATVHDIAAFVAAEMPGYSTAAEGVLPRESIELLHTPHVPLDPFFGLAFDSYALGHFVERLPSGHKAIAHGGQGSGWMTHFHAIPATGDGIILLTNSQRAWPVFARILDDWARWAGFGGVGMDVIIAGERVLYAVCIVLLAVASLLGWRLVRDLHAGRRRFGRARGRSAAGQAAQVIVAAALIGGVTWGAGSEHFFLSAVFPIVLPRLGATLILLGLVLALAGATTTQATSGIDRTEDAEARGATEPETAARDVIHG